MCGPKGDTAVGPSPVDRGRPGSKHHLLVDAGGLPLAVRVTGGNRHDVTQLLPLVEQVPPIRGRRGRPLRRPGQLVGDRAYDSDPHRRALRALGIRPRLARRRLPHGSGLGQMRWVVERSFAWLHAFKRLNVRWEYRADIHQALLTLVCCLICWRQLQRSS
jgi:transposase